MLQELEEKYPVACAIAEMLLFYAVIYGIFSFCFPSLSLLPMDEFPLNRITVLKAKVPEPYYVPTQSNENLSDLIEILKGIEFPYIANYWDCSESSAYLERYLENKGFTTYICVNHDIGHAWLWVRVRINGSSQFIPVEATRRPHISLATPLYLPEEVYKDIYTALVHEGEEEFAWWHREGVCRDGCDFASPSRRVSV